MGQKMKGFFEKLNETCCISQRTKSRMPTFAVSCANAVPHFLFRISAGVFPNLILTNLPKKEGLGKFRALAISLMLHSECFNWRSTSFATASKIHCKAGFPVVRLTDVERYLGVTKSLSANSLTV